jgi:DNA polymerase phi
MSTLQLFWHLSSTSKAERIDASVKLIGSLEQFQLQFVCRDSSDSTLRDEGPEPNGLDVLNAQDVTYAIKRLVRGMASPRKSSRLGFAVALTEACVRSIMPTLLLIVLPLASCSLV